MDNERGDEEKGSVKRRKEIQSASHTENSKTAVTQSVVSRE